MSARLWGVFGRPYLDLSSVVDTSRFAAIDREVTLGLARVETQGTGATLKWMGVVAPWAMDDGRRDAMDAIRAMSDEELRDFVALGGYATPVDLARRDEYDFGDETERPFTPAQQRALEFRHGVYFPWRHSYHLLENDRWDDKHSGANKRFGDEALEVFPETCALVRALPFAEIGRCVIFGLAPHDHAPLHRDTEPGAATSLAQCITLAPRPGKRLYLQNAPAAAPLVVDAPAYWFNDMDYHGVLPDPFFRYSIRVDGVFTRAFARDLARLARRSPRPAPEGRAR